MPPVSPTANGFLPNSTNEFCPENPCQPSLTTQGGSIRPVETVEPSVGPLEPPTIGPAATEAPSQSAVAQYTAPGTRSTEGTGTCSAVFASLLPILEFPHGAVPPPVHAGLPSAGPPASYTTCVPVFLKRVESDSITYQLNSGNTSLKPALPARSVLLKLE